MIRSVTATNYLDESIKLELFYPDRSGLAITNIDGLGPPKATINSTDFASADGASYNSARISSRNIVLSLELLPKPTIEATRQLSYKYFPIKQNVRLLIETDSRVVETEGHVESNEPGIFSNRETSQISIICNDPYLYSAGSEGTKETVFSGVVPNFEFPFSNESLTEPMIEFGIIRNQTSQNIPYTGDFEIGVQIIIHAIGSVEDLTIYNSGTREVMRLSSAKLVTLTGSGIINGDDIIISTVRGNKTIQLLRNGIYTNILNCLNKDADWFQLRKGDNVFAYAATLGETNLQFSVTNKIIYEGV